MNHDVDLAVWPVEDQLSMLLTLNEDLRAAAEEAEAACAATGAEEAAAAKEVRALQYALTEEQRRSVQFTLT